jgi:hypothetical protein
MYQNSKKIIVLAGAMVLLFSGWAIAQTKVLGLFELGKSTYTEVKAKLPKEVHITVDNDKIGASEDGGPVIVTQGTGYGIDRLLDVGFLFDNNQTLAEVRMGLDDGRFNDIKKILSSKYRLVRSYPGVRLLFKANRDYVYLYFQRDAVKDKPDTYKFGVQYMTGAVYRQEQLDVRQTVENKKAPERKVEEEVAKF